jgi:hypothetical protein
MLPYQHRSKDLLTQAGTRRFAPQTPFHFKPQEAKAIPGALAQDYRIAEYPIQRWNPEPQGATL